MFMFLYFVACQQDTNTSSTSVEPAKQEASAKSDVAAKPPAHAHNHTGHSTTSGDGSASVDPGPVPEAAKVYFKSPAEGATVKSPVRFEMVVEGMTVQPAGEIKDGTGHHHILVDALPVTKGAAIPADSKHIHFGKGQTNAELELSSGQHTVQLQFANGAHLSYGPQLSSTITITVE